MADVHALVVPVPGDGHINGLLRLAQTLASHGLIITFGYPARAHALRRNASQLHPAIRVEVIPDGLPTEEGQLPTIQQLLATASVMQNAWELLIEKLSAGPLPPSYIISDTFAPWTQDLADKVGLPRVDFWTSTATVYSMGFHLPELISRGHLPSKGAHNHWNVEAPLVDFIPGLPAFPVSELPKEFLFDDLSHPQLQFMLAAFSRVRDAHTVLVHSVYELESDVIDALQADQIPIYSVGPLFHSELPKETLTSDKAAIPSTRLANDIECLKWLDRQVVASVVYVAFGTMAMLFPEETHELALGLEGSGHPFIWAIRADLIQGELSSTLPNGFLSRTGNRGLITSWAPQQAVLEHPSVGAFFTHCGWNSNLESLWAGKPMVACPLTAEQRSNARQVVDKWKVGVELERKDNWSFTRKAVEEAVKAIMRNSEAQQRAHELQQVVRQTVAEGGTSYRNLADFVRNLKRRVSTQ